jgi:hypothetical protein
MRAPFPGSSARGGIPATLSASGSTVIDSPRCRTNARASATRPASCGPARSGARPGRRGFSHFQQYLGDGTRRDGLDRPHVEHLRLRVMAGQGDQLAGSSWNWIARSTVLGTGPLAAARSCSSLAA